MAFSHGTQALLGWAGLSILWAAISATAQISPGALSRAHQSLNGATDCTACHGLSTGKPTFRCIECHGEIGSRIAAQKGLHATYSIKSGSSQECIACHSDHNGEDFPLVKWDFTTFDHNQTGYALEGKHAGVTCYQCHTANHVAPNERPTIKIKDLNRTFLGLSQGCVSCHQDQHQGRLGPNCLQCHNYSDWKTVSVGKFDHSTTRYPLTGLHAQVTCQKCHMPGRDRKPRYTGIAFSKCADCHSDPHRGGFSQSCESCHSTNGWSRISGSSLDENFNHATTQFPLLGKHAEVECVQCHAGGDFKKPLAFQKCTDCHQPDPHGGQFAKRIGGGECTSCHTVEGFKPSTFGVKEHAATAYPLQGKHASLPCAQCHIPKGLDGKDTMYKIKFQHCTDCHRDPHAAQFAATPYFNRCETCHNLQRFAPATFTLARHQQTKFPLTESHQAIACADCHKPSPEFKPPTTRYRWRNLALHTLTCTECHADPHRGQFANLMRTAKDGSPRGCEVCHSTKSWKEFSRFDHSRTSFPLLGVHLSTPCSACHKAPDQRTAPANVDFKTAPTQCEACHENIHGAQFARAGVPPCVECHNSAQWKPSLFDHDVRTSFPLQGAHRQARCEGCHKLTRAVAGRTVLFYKPTPKECVACHGPATRTQ